MKKLSVRILLLWSALAGAALAQKGNVAILDLDEVARVLKVDQAMIVEMRDLELDLNSQLNQHRQEFQSQMSEAEKRAGEPPAPEMQQQLLDFNRKLNRDFQMLRNQASQQLDALRVEKINRFRRQLEPIARQAAQSNGLEVVITKTAQVFVYPEEIDITMEVIERARAAGMEAKVEVRVPVESPPDPATTSETAIETMIETGIEKKMEEPQEIKQGAGSEPVAEPAPEPATDPVPAQEKGEKAKSPQ